MSLKHCLNALRSQNGLNFSRGVHNKIRLSWISGAPLAPQVQIVACPTRHYGSYYKSRTEESPDKYTKFEKSYAEWKFVERLIPPTHVPDPPSDPNLEYPSGWKPMNPPKDVPYNIRRTKNHLIPVYEQIFDRGETRLTHIKRVEGDIWQLEKDIGDHLARLFPTEVISTKVYEVSRIIIIRGNYVEPIKEWLLQKGF